MDRKRAFRLAIRVSVYLWLLLLFGWRMTYADTLTLKQAEKAALSQSPEIKSLQAQARALGQLAIAAGQLSDPKFIVGTKNVPVNTFNFNQEPMTQIQVGLLQSFPKGRSLHYHALQTEDLSLAKFYKQQAIRLQVFQGVRLSWLDLFYWFYAKEIILKQKRVFWHLVKVAESMLANNKAQQKDVIRAQLEVTELDNRLLEVDQHIETARAQLARWIGPTLAKQAILQQLPRWPSPPRVSQMQQLIKQHPLLQADQAMIFASHAGVNFAEQQFKPGVKADVIYGFRQGHDFDGRRRADFITADVVIDLPIFPHNRQDRTLTASEDKLLASEEDQMSHYRQLREALRIQYAAWRQQQKSAWLYQSKLIPEAKQYAQATMTAYQNVQTDFPTLARAYVRELNTELAGLRATVDRQIARVNLLYLQGR